MESNASTNPRNKASSSPLPISSPSSARSAPSPSGIPFKWEKLPGIPKKQTRNNSVSSPKLGELLPLPPSATDPKKQSNPADGSVQKKSSLEWDPFVAALVECSKDDDSCHRDDRSRRFLTVTKVSRSIGDPFGFIGLYTSCKKGCAIDESIIHISRPKT